MSENSAFKSKFQTLYIINQVLGKNNVQGKVFHVSKRQPVNSNAAERQDFVIKCICLPTTKSGDETTEEKRAYNEIRALECMDHPNIVKYYESWTEVPPRGWKYQSHCLQSAEKVIFILMEYCSGGDLDSWLSSHRTDEEVHILVCQMLDAMIYIHGQKILHRDLKPANVFIAENNVVKIGDFGLSREWDEKMSSRPGTPLYRAPEILMRGGHQYGYEIDVYSFGLIYFEIIYQDVRRRTIGTQIETWYEIMKYKRGEAEKPRQFTSLHPKEDLLLDWMLERDPKSRMNFVHIKSAMTGTYFWYDAARKQQYGELSERTMHIRIINGEEMLDITDCQVQQLKLCEFDRDISDISVQLKLDLGIHLLSLYELRSFTFELFNTRNPNYGIKDNVILDSIRTDVTKFVSLFFPNNFWDSRINLLVVDHGTRIFELNHDRRTYFGGIMNPIFSLEKISDDAVESMTLYLSHDLRNKDLLKFKSLTTLNLNRIITDIDFKTLFASDDNFPSLTILSVQFVKLTKLRLNDFKFNNLSSLFFGMVELDCQGMKENLHVKRLTLEDSSVGDEISIVAEQYILFCNDLDTFYSYYLIDHLITSGAEQIYYDKLLKRATIFLQIWKLKKYKTQLESHFEKDGLDITNSINVKLVCCKQTKSILSIESLSSEQRDLQRSELNDEEITTIFQSRLSSEIWLLSHSRIQETYIEYIKKRNDPQKIYQKSYGTLPFSCTTTKYFHLNSAEMFFAEIGGDRGSIVRKKLFPQLYDL